MLTRERFRKWMTSVQDCVQTSRTVTSLDRRTIFRRVSVDKTSQTSRRRTIKLLIDDK